VARADWGVVRADWGVSCVAWGVARADWGVARADWTITVRPAEHEPRLTPGAASEQEDGERVVAVSSPAMIDHITVKVSDLDRALAFYKVALAPLGYSVLMEFPGAVGMGVGGKPDLWLGVTTEKILPTHVALAADRDEIDAFHAAGLTAGGRDNGAPGLRAHYHPNYYGAFLLDPDGNNIEAVSHAPPAAPKAARKAAKKKAPAKKAAKKAPAKKAPAKKAAKKKAPAKKAK
jgi:catechol 2,3-dioxygenase-like lactoylglutathione lyase family enzyme